MFVSLGFGSTKIGNFQILHFPDKKHMDFSNTSKGTRSTGLEFRSL